MIDTTKTARAYCYLRDWSSLNRQDLHSATPEDLVRGLSITSDDFTDDPEWPLVGFATVTFELLPREKSLTIQVEALKAARKNVLATAQAAATRIDQQINSLLAIANEAPK